MCTWNSNEWLTCSLIALHCTSYLLILRKQRYVSPKSAFLKTNEKSRTQTNIHSISQIYNTLCIIHAYINTFEF